MFARKGTCRRVKQQQSSRRPRRASLPIVNPACDVEAGESSVIPEQTVPSAPSTTSSTLTLNEEKSLVDRSRSYSRLDSYQTVSYGSLILQLREAQLESSNLWDFLQRICEIVWQSFVMTVFLMFFTTLPISMVAMGTSYLEECPKEPKIPIYLLVGGAFGIILMCFLLWQQKKSRSYTMLEDSKDDPDTEENDIMRRSNRFTLYMLILFLLFWFAIGNYWLFSIWKPNFSQPLHEPRNWCSYLLYNYTFYQILICYILALCVLLIFIGCLVAYSFEASRK